MTAVLIASSPITDVVVRDLRLSDRVACELFFQRLARYEVDIRHEAPAFSLAYFCAGLGGPNAAAAFGAFDAEQSIVGIINLIHLAGRGAEIALIVHPDHRRRGIGRNLVKQAMAWAERNGRCGLIGYVHPENRVMLALIRTLGFRQTGWTSFLLEMTWSSEGQQCGS